MKTRSVLRIKYFSFLFCLKIYNLGFSFRAAFIMKMILNLLEKVAVLETKKLCMHPKDPLRLDSMYSRTFLLAISQV